MKKIFILVFSIFMFLQTIPQFTIGEEPSTLIKYLVPAKITKLDWILLKVQTSVFTQKMQWDDYGLINSVDLFVAYVKDNPYIGLTFLVDNSQYMKLENYIIEKISRYVIEVTAKIIQIQISELKFKKDILANFVVVETGKTIAKYIDGKFEFIE